MNGAGAGNIRRAARQQGLTAAAVRAAAVGRGRRRGATARVTRGQARRAAARVTRTNIGMQSGARG